jgi:hypothetical protein
MELKMITLQRLLNSTIVALIAVSVLSPVQAQTTTEFCPKEFNVLERDKKDGYIFAPRKLEKLFCNESFEGEHFKIVLATEDHAISFNHEDKELLKKAANVYYHLTIARNFWMSEIKSDFVERLPQLVIRLDITNAFSSTRHFKNEEQVKNYNNAWSIPAGSTPSFVKDGKKWNKEIWFSPMKKLEARKLVESDGSNPIHESLVLVKDPIISYNKNKLLYSGVQMLAYPNVNNSSLLELTLKTLGPIAVVYGLISVSKYMDHWFMDKYYFIDTAMVPEIIYHEYAHIAMSDTMKTVHSVPVIEGMADYFAARIANRRRMYEKINKISSNKSKDLKNKKLYHPFLEGAWNATSDFTLGLLWEGKVRFDAANELRTKKGQPTLGNYDELIHHSHFGLSENSDIANDLTSALIETCKEKCTGVRAGVNLLHNVFEAKGLN